MPLQFETAWSDLNLRLRELEMGAGLTEAMHALEDHHRESGFIKDTLQEVERYTFHHPQDPDRCFRVQYNPRRALRFAGAGQKQPTLKQRNNGCFLCRENIEWQQEGRQLGYRVENDERAYIALMNPFPLMPTHVVMALSEHIPQDWHIREANGLDLPALIDDLIQLADRMPSYVGFYNGVDAGASIPGHLHYQFVRRPDDDRVFPLEFAKRSAGAHNDGPAFVEQYPLDVAVWRGLPGEVTACVRDWIAHWRARNCRRLPEMTANFIAMRDAEAQDVTLYFIPRHRAKSKATGFSGLVGGLEVLGEVVLSSPEDKRRLDNGLIDYFVVENALASVRTPMYES